MRSEREPSSVCAYQNEAERACGARKSFWTQIGFKLCVCNDLVLLPTCVRFLDKRGSIVDLLTGDGPIAQAINEKL
jgi:hypothetical protein